MPKKPHNKAELEYAGFWLRLGAALIDGVLLVLLSVPFLLAIYGGDYLDPQAREAAGGMSILGGWDFFFNYVFPAVVTILLWMKFQATPGKMAISAKIVDAKTGDKPTSAQCIGRYLAYFASAIPFGMGFLWVAFDKRKQGWHDKLAGTVVIRNRANDAEPVSFKK